MFNIVLYEPVIPQNTGSIARLCACTGATLHLIRPLGFKTDAASVKRAGLDYWPHVKMFEYENWSEFFDERKPSLFFLLSKFATRSYFDAKFYPDSYLVFGSETKGLPESLRNQWPSHCYQIPMRTHVVRSLNLAQSAAIVLYEAIRQNEVNLASQMGRGPSKDFCQDPRPQLR